MNRACLLVALALIGACGEGGGRPGQPGTSDCIDEDGDGFGLYCEPGPDCDEADAEVHEGCMWCSPSRPAAGCPCEGEAVVDCYSSDPILDENGDEVCQAGERQCIDGAWGVCEYTDTFPVPDWDQETPGAGDDEDMEQHREEIAAPPLRVDDWAGGGCNVCGAVSYQCTSWGTYDPDADFADPLPAGAIVTQVSVDLYGVNCNAGSRFRIELNGTLVQEQNDPAPVVCACNTCGGPATYTSPVYAAPGGGGFPGYVYGGVNTVNVNSVGGLYCLNYVDMRLEYSLCGNGLLEPAEECDDGNLIDGDGCDAACLIDIVAVCGDGLVQGAETCDDANVAPGDGCDDTCQVEPGWSCEGGGVGAAGETPPVRADGWAGGGCNVCGAADYQCTTWGSYTPDATFLDAIPAGATATQVFVDLYGVNCDVSSRFRVDVNGTLVEERLDPAPVLCACDSCGGPTTYTSPVYPIGGGGFPGYAPGALNTVNVNPVAGLYCLNYVEVRVAYEEGAAGPSVCVQTCGNGVIDPGEQCDDANADDADDCHNDCTRPVGPRPCGVCDLQCVTEDDWATEDGVDDRSSGVEWDPDLGGIVLGASATTSKYSYIASNSMGTVSKIDQTTGAESGRYYTGPPPNNRLNPSRTAIDGFGDAYVANRAIIGSWFGPSSRQGTIVKIAGDLSNCRNGAANTSLNNVPLPWGTDDCILWEASIGSAVGSMPRGLAISKGDGAHPQGYVWVGATTDVDGPGYGRAYKLDPDNGAVLCSVQLPVSVYGMTSDGQDPERLWFSSYLQYGELASVWADDCTLADTAVRPPDPGGRNRSYAVSTDGTGRIIAAGFTGRVRIYDPSIDEWCFADVRGAGTPIGVAADLGRTDGVTTQDPRIWASAGGRLAYFDRDEPCVPSMCSSNLCTAYSAPGGWFNCTASINVNEPCGLISGARVGTVFVGGGMGVGIDFTEHNRVWVASSNSPVYDPLTGVTVIYPTTGAISGSYTYTDFTGFGFQALVSPEGYYWQDFGDPPACGAGQRPAWGLLNWNADTPPGTHLRFEARTASTLAGLGLAANVALGETPPETSPPGIDVGAALRAAGVSDNQPYLRIRVVLISDSRDATPVFYSMNQEWVCVDSE